MKVKVVTQQINQVREGKSDFSSLLDAIHLQTISKKKVVSLAAVKRTQQFNRCLNPPVVE